MKSVDHGTESIGYFTESIGYGILLKIRSRKKPFLNNFPESVKPWLSTNFYFRFCKVYMHGVDFIDSH